VQVATIDKPRAEIMQAEANAISVMMAAVKDTPRACVQFGSFLLVKIDGELTVRRLKPSEVKAVEENEIIIRKPEEVIALLSNEPDTPRK
jgi:hypothetical protein